MAQTVLHEIRAQNSESIAKHSRAMLVRLVARDGREFEVDKDDACFSETIKAMIDEDWSPEDAIPLAIESSVLARIIEFFTYHQPLATIQLCEQQRLDRNSWNTEFVRVDDEVRMWQRVLDFVCAGQLAKTNEAREFFARDDDAAAGGGGK